MTKEQSDPQTIGELIDAIEEGQTQIDYAMDEVISIAKQHQHWVELLQSRYPISTLTWVVDGQAYRLHPERLDLPKSITTKWLSRAENITVASSIDKLPQEEADD